VNHIDPFTAQFVVTVDVAYSMGRCVRLWAPAENYTGERACLDPITPMLEYLTEASSTQSRKQNGPLNYDFS